ncbi:MAG: hypothetical protein RIB32_00150 [Phycisphaerales bacterium]
MNPTTLIACCALLTPVALGQNIIFVDDDAGGADDGTSWNDAFQSLEEALALAKDFDQVWVAQGVYQPKANGDETSSFIIPNFVSVYGGFEGDESDPADRDDWLANASVLLGELTGGVGDINHIVTISGLDGCLLDGFVIQSGHAQASLANPNGAGILIENSDAALKNLAVLDCTAAGNGGAIAILGEGIVTIDDSFFDSNNGAYGGALYAEWPVQVTNCEFTDNVAAFTGGAVHLAGQGVHDLRDSRFEGNTAGDGGGAIHSALQRVNTTTATLVTNSVFVGNTTDNTGGDGGAILFTSDGQHEVQRCRFIGNYSIDEGGAIATDLTSISRLLIENSLISGNIAVDRGAGVFQTGPGELWITNSTILGNDGGNNGAGVFTFNGDFLLANSILWDNSNVNTAGDPRQDEFSFNGGPSRSIDVAYSRVQFWGTSPVSGAIDTSGEVPGLAQPLGADGIYGTEDDNAALAPGAAAIDAANNLYVGPLGFLDIEGNNRFQDDTGTPDTGVQSGFGGTADIGAFEFQGTTVPCPADCDGNGTLNLDDVDCFVAAFLASDAAADCDASGTLNLDDVDCFVASFLGGCP